MKALNKLFQERKDACAKLEAALSATLRQATRAWRARQTRHRKEQKKRNKDEEGQGSPGNLHLPEPSMDLLDDLVPQEKRPKHRIRFMGLFGRKVETITYCKVDVQYLDHSAYAEP